MSSPLRSRLRLLILGLFGLHLAISLVLAARTSLWQVRRACRLAGEDQADSRRRVFGGAYVAAVEGIRRAIPPAAPYLLVAGKPQDDGGALWVRFDLAPRRPLLLGDWNDLPPARKLRRRLPRGIRWVVVAHGSNEPPRLLDRRTFLRALERWQSVDP